MTTTIRTEIAEKIAAAINAGPYAARAWTGDKGDVRIYVRWGSDDIGYVEINADGSRNYDTLRTTPNGRVLLTRTIKASGVVATLPVVA